MITFRFARLVRGKIPEFYRSLGNTVVSKKLSGRELREALIQKLHEEVDDALRATDRAKMISEIADIQEIVKDVCELENITSQEIQESIDSKVANKGKFSDGQYIDTVTFLDENSQWAQYCQQSPDKYEEIK